MCIRRVNHASNNLSFPASHAFRLGLFAGLVFICTFSTALAEGPRHPGRYVPPPSSYILAPGETPITLQFDSIPLATVQK